MNSINTGPNLARVAMPLARLMQHNLSWRDREIVADAIQQAIAHHKSMEDERRHLEQSAGCTASSAAGVQK